MNNRPMTLRTASKLPLTTLLKLVGPVALFPSLHASDIFKADNADALNLSTSWDTNALPTAENIAVFDSRITSIPVDATTGRRYMPFPVATAWRGIRVDNAPTGLSIDTFDGVAAYGNQALTLGAGGINMTSAAANSLFELDRPNITLAPATVQTWDVADTATLQVNGSISFGLGTLLKINPVSNGTVLVSSNTLGNIPAVLGKGPDADFANGIAETSPTTRTRLIPSNQNSANTKNPAPDATTLMPTPALTETGYSGLVDFSNQYTTDGTTPLEGMTVPNGGFISGFRFSKPNLRTDGVEQWTVSHSTTGTGRTTTPSLGVIVTEGVGTDNVVFGGNFFFRIDNNNNRLILHQDNPSGDLIFRNTGGINARNAAAAHIVKSGRGRVVIENGIGANNGLYIYEGTMTFGAGGTVGNPGSGPIINQSSLVFNRSDLITVGGIISGAGTLTKQGAGTLSLTGANTYTGLTTISQGVIAMGNASALGNGDITFTGGSITFGSGVNTDISVKSDGASGVVSRALTLASGVATFDVGANNVFFSSSIGQNGAGGLTKAGSGTLSFAAANSYSGNTSVANGTLVISNAGGSATGSGAVSVANTANLTGSGSIAGVVSIANGGNLSPGASGVGNITLGGLNLVNGSLVNLEFASTSSHDTITTTANNGLTLNGGNIRLFQPGTEASWTPIAGTYNIATYNGTIQGAGPNSLAVTNPVAGYGYTFSAQSGVLRMSVALESILSQWTPISGGSWGDAGSWSNGVPIAGYTPLFTTNQSLPATVTLDGNRTINGLVFSSTAGSGYVINAGTGGSLTLSKATGNVAVNINSGEHIINTAVAIAPGMSVTSAQFSGLTISGAVSGGALTKNGPGYLNLTGNNSFSGPVLIAGGDVRFTQSSGLGTGAITLDGGMVSYNAGNTTDLSNRQITIATFGGSINTNGNDVSFANPIGNNGDGALTKTGAGTLSLAPDNTYKGGTQVLGGTLRINHNSALGLPIEGSPLLLDGGGVTTTISLTLDNQGSNARSVTIGANGGILETFGAQTSLTIPGSLRGPGGLTKTGLGTLTLSGNNNVASGNQYTGAINLSSGRLILAGGQANGQRALGTGAITFGHDTTLQLNGYGVADNSTSWGELFHAMSVPRDVTATLLPPARVVISGPLTGEGALNVEVAATRQDYSGNWGAFAGRINLTGAGEFRLHNFQSSVFNNADLNIGTGVTVYQNFNPPSGTGTVTTQNIGALSGPAGSVLSGQLVSGRFVNWSIGARNMDSEFAGVISDLRIQASPTDPVTFGQTRVTKVGTGTLTLSGVNTYTSTTTISAGTLRVNGELAGRPAEAAFSTVTVGAEGTLAGSGTIAGPTTVSGRLHPSAGDDGVATLTFGNTVTLLGTSVIDLVGTNHDRVVSTSNSGLVYGGTLSINQLGTAYNGTYPIFGLSGPELGDFASVQVTNDSGPGTLNNNGSGVWTGTVGSISYSFSEATGVLTVSGGSTAVTPAVPTALQAAAGNAQVSLTWNAAANASTYLIKRSTTSGGPYTTIATNAATTYTDLAVTNDTTYYYVVQARSVSGNLSADSAQVSATPTAPTITHTALQEWRFAQFGVYDDTTEVLAGDTEDFDGDGLANLLEYALNTNPKVPNASPVTAGRSGNFLTLSYPVNADPALTYAVQGSSDLAAGFATGSGTTQTSAGVATYTDNVALGTGIRRFLRLIVGYNSAQ